MSSRLGTLVARHWALVLVAWLVLVAGVQILAPRWDDVTHDGDFAYLPKAMTSVQGEKLLEAAFPRVASKSQVALVVARPDGPLEPADFDVAHRLVEQFTPGEDDHGPVTGVWSYESQVVGRKLISRPGSDGQAVLIVLHLRNEFMAVQNMGLMSSIYRSLDVVQLEEALAVALDGQCVARSDLGELARADEPEQRAALAGQLRAQQADLRDWVAPLAGWFGGTDPREAEPIERVLAKVRLVLDGPVRDALDEAAGQSDALAGVKTLDGLAEPAKRLEAVQGRAIELIKEAHGATEGALEVMRELSIAEDGPPDEMPEDARDSLAALEARLDAILAEQQAAGSGQQAAGSGQREVAVVGPPGGLQIGVTGSAAVGSDMLEAAKQSIRNTELATVLLVVVILLIVYRAPGLVAVPLVTIVASTAVAMGLIALATRLSEHVAWLDFKVFKTTKIFIVVIVFGAGTDYCLFLISRYKEELARGLDHGAAIARSLGCVGDALAASALTTIFGLATMIFADFGKFRNSGPVIAFCLVVALAACVTLAPALLRGAGRIVFWPLGTGAARGATRPDGPHTGDPGAPRAELAGPAGPSVFGWFWQRVAGAVIARPGLILVVSLLLLAPLAAKGLFSPMPLTYDLLSELRADRPSVQGTRLLEQYFLSGETGPVTVLAYDKNGGFNTKPGTYRIALLTRFLYDLDYLDEQGGRRTDANGNPIDPIVSVRSLTEPLGGAPGSFSPLSTAGRSRLAVLRHPKTKATFLAQSPGQAGHVTRLDLIFPYDPFSRESVDALGYVQKRLEALADGSCNRWPDSWWPKDLTAKQRQELASQWQGVTFRFVGTTAGIRDLRTVTASDQRRIQQLVVIAVLAVLIVILRRPVVCLYLVASVLLGYFVTIGVTEWFFRWCYGPTFDGLDWKVPIFLFVLLIAVGADYNIYLTTRVFEEQRRLGMREGLRTAVVRTGGIITSCGVIMAGTFASMATGTLRAMQELGFALALGVLLDTFVIRTILVPALLALRQGRAVADETPVEAEILTPGPTPHLGKTRPGLSPGAETAQEAASAQLRRVSPRDGRV